MQTELKERLESFLAEDLLVGLGALRMSLSWLGNGEADRPAAGFSRLDTELARLEGQAVAVYRLLRDPAPPPVTEDRANQVAVLAGPPPVPMDTDIPQAPDAREEGAILDPLPDPAVSLWHPNAMESGLDTPANVFAGATDALGTEPVPAGKPAPLGDSIDALLSTAVEARKRTGSTSARPPLDALQAALRQARASRPVASDRSSPSGAASL